MIIRSETAAAAAVLREVNRRAFGRPAESALVDRVRAQGLVAASLVAGVAGTVRYAEPFNGV